MKSKILGVRLEDNVREELERRAIKKGKTLSSYAAELLTEALEGEQRIDLMVANIHEECLQLESMLSVMQGYNKEIHSILLGRTDPGKFANSEDFEIAKERRKKAEKMIVDIQSQTIEKMMHGADVWGLEKEEFEKGSKI